MTDLLLYVDIALAILAALLWLGVWWTLRTFPVAPVMPLWPVRPAHSSRISQRELEDALYLGSFCASASSSVVIKHPSG